MAVSNPATLQGICTEMGLYGANRKFTQAIAAVMDPTFFTGKNIRSMKAWAGYVNGVPISVSPTSALFPAMPDSEYPGLSRTFSVTTVGEWSFQPPEVHLGSISGPIAAGWTYEKVSSVSFRVTMEMRSEGDPYRKYGTAVLFTPSGTRAFISLVQKGNPDIPDPD